MTQTQESRMNNRAKMEESIRTLYGKVFNARQANRPFYLTIPLR
jgi:hypothetical protein